MSRIDEKQVAVAKVYSHALLELADDEALSLLEELEGLVALLDTDADLREFFASPLVDESVREKALEKVFRGRASDLLVDSLQVLNRHDRLAYLGTIVALYRQETQEREGHVDVHVTSAVPLTDGVRKELAGLASRLYGRQPDLIETVDESLIGGLVLRVGDRKIDTSVATQLSDLRQQLADRAAREIYESRRAAEA